MKRKDNGWYVKGRVCNGLLSLDVSSIKLCGVGVGVGVDSCTVQSVPGESVFLKRQSR